MLFPVCYVGGLALSHAFTYFPWYYGPIYPFLAVLAIIAVCDLAPAELERALSRISGGNRNAVMRYLRAIFNHGIKRGYR